MNRQWLKMVLRPRVFLPALVVLGAVGALATYVILLHPDSTLMRWVRAAPPEQFGMITIGPYPQEEDFPRLKKQGVKYIVSLLDAQIPYEKPMLEKEMALGKKYGIEVKNFPMFPMDSILNTAILPGTEKEEQQAVDFLEHLDAPAYVHCYLGRHRAIRVRGELLMEGGQLTASGSGQGDWEVINLIAAAQAQFRDHEYAKVLVTLEPVTQADVDVSNLRGWSYFRLGLFTNAEQSFREGLAVEPDNPRNQLGLGFCYLQNSQPVMAQREFNAVLQRVPDEPDGLMGQGLAYLQLQDKPAAARVFRKILEINPNNEEVKNYLKQAESS